MASGTLIAPPERAADAKHPARQSVHRCECGRVLRVFGGGRHRVYLELDDVRSDDPVMNRVCPGCGAGLPGKNRPGRQ